MHKEVKEFNILGQSIRLKESSENDKVSPQEIVDFVNIEIDEIKKIAPGLGDSQLAVLVALKLAEDKISLEKNYKNDIRSLQLTARDALKLIEEVSPTSH